MLLLLKLHPTRSLGDIAVNIGSSARSVSRWWKAYQTSGLNALLGSVNSSRDDLSSPSETPSSVDSPTSLAQGNSERVWEIQDQLIRKLNQFPVDTDMGVWSLGVRDVLQAAFDDVDRVTINVNVNCDLLHPDAYQPRLFISQDAYPDNPHKGLGIARRDTAKTNIAEDLIREFQRQGYPVDNYHPPFILNLEYRGAYLGTLFLWREQSNTPISSETISLVSQLENFLIYVMSDVILRHHYTAPVERAFYSTLREISAQASLTAQEHRVITYRLLGLMYKEIAAELNISQDSVKKTLQQIYRKTGTGSHIEFFAKYFTIRVVASRPAEEDPAA